MKRIYFCLALFVVQFAVFSELYAQEAFYIYRNDGGVNGFFYDEVVRMGYSKVDLDNIEYDTYVVQEVETKDSLYRIPLCVIDSVGFQQPEIIFNENFYDITAEDCPYKGYTGTDTFYSLEVDSMGFMLYWEPCEFNQETREWICHEELLPKVGDVLYIPNGAWNEWSGKYNMPLIGKVTKVREYVEYRNHVYCVYCTFVDDINDVFEQFISVEQIGVDDEGEAYTRMAGMNKIRKRVEGNTELTLLSFGGHFTPIDTKLDKLKIRLSVDLSVSVKLSVNYNISRKNFNITMDFKEDAEFGASFAMSGTLEDTTISPLATVPIAFPTWLPILQVSPGVGTFLKTSGDMNFTISTPKLAAHCTQTITINKNGVSGKPGFTTGADDPNNTWGMEIALNGSAQAGTSFPAQFQTAAWMKKFAFASMGFDVLIGPKFEAAFTLDPLSLASLDAYNTFKNSQIKFSKVVLGVEGSAIFSTAGTQRKKYKVLEAEEAAGSVSLNLFPDFEKVKLGDVNYYLYNDDWHGRQRSPTALIDATVYPRGNTPPYYVGVGVYNKEKKLVCAKAARGHGMYSFFNSWNEETITLNLYDGTYTICPHIDFFGYTIPAWDAGKEVFADTPFYVCEDDMYEKWKGYLRVQYVLNKDEGIRIDCDDESLGFYADLVERRPMSGQDPTAEEYFEEVTFEYNITNHNWTGVYPKPFTVSSWRTKPESRRRETKVSLAVPWPRVDY
jgi:hypothetical protein